MKIQTLLVCAYLSLASSLTVAESIGEYLSEAAHAYKAGNYAKAAKSWEKSCNLGHTESCTALGQLYTEDKVVKPNYAKAAKFLEKTCNDDYTNGCTRLARLYIEGGHGVKEDFGKGLQILKKSCEKGDKKSCRLIDEIVEKYANIIEQSNHQKQLKN